MIVQDTPNHVHTGGEQKKTEFRMLMNGKSFKLLLSDIYSDRISAFIREIGTNAFEAHQVAGKESTPFDVTLPSSTIPNFVVRDYGPGLDDKDVEDIYTVVFSSTKTDSNNLGGCFGLGSKSPFAYSNNFVITTWKDSVKRIYSVFKNAEGIPVMSLLAESASDEPSGVEVNIPINPTDISAVCYRAYNVYRWFDVRPNIVNGEYPKCEEPIFKGKTCSVYRKLKPYNKLSVKMGNIVYSIENRFYDKAFFDTCVVLNVKIGDVTPEPGRERLTYTPATEKFIVKAVDSAREEFLSFLENSLQNEPSYLAACIKASTYGRVIARYRGVYLSTQFSNTESCGVFEYNGVRLKKYKHCISNISISRHEAVRFIYLDTRKYHLIKIRNYLSNNTGVKYIFLISDKNKFISDIGCLESDIINVSSLDYKPPPKVYTPRGTTARRTKVLAFKNSYSNSSLSYWVESQATFGQYVPYYNGRIVVGSSYQEPSKFASMLHTLDIPYDSVYGIRVCDIEKLDTSKWKEFLPLTRDRFLSTFLSKVKDDTNNVKETCYQLRFIDTVKIILRIQNSTELPSDIKLFLDEYRKALSCLSSLGIRSIFEEYRDKFYPDIVLPKPPSSGVRDLEWFRLQIENLNDKYPLLLYIKDMESPKVVQHVVNYTTERNSRNV